MKVMFGLIESGIIYVVFFVCRFISEPSRFSHLIVGLADCPSGSQSRLGKREDPR